MSSACEPMTGPAVEAAARRRIESVLVANRGEIACRVISGLAELGVRTVAVYSDADADAPHVRLADVAVRLGPAAAGQSYLDVEKVLAAVASTGVDAVHPGYGFLSERADFARRLEAAGVAFLGPPASAIEEMGDKISARAAVSRRGVPVVPGLSEPGLTDADIVAAAGQEMELAESTRTAGVGFPLLIKPSAGGGGKGMHVVDDLAALPAALAAARREAMASFGDDTLFVERYLKKPRHIEVQVLADAHGAVVHLGERECSLQRRHQKVIEEAPSPAVSPEFRARLGEAACDAARSVGYIGVGTVEFIVPAGTETFYFLEMNTRLQVEHPVTELVTGVDLVEQQLRVARGEPLTFTQDDVTLTGHAVEARVYAEDPGAGFLPTGGTVRALTWPTGAGVRVDAGIVAGQEIGLDYDPMLAKVIAHGSTRAEALARLDRALARTTLLGVGTNIDFLRSLLAEPRVVAGDLDTHLLDGWTYRPASAPLEALAAAALARLDTGRSWEQGDPWAADGWRLGRPALTRFVFRDGAAEHIVLARPGEVVVDDVVHEASAVEGGLVFDGRRIPVAVVADRREIWVATPDGTWRFTEPVPGASATADEGAATSPMPGTVIAVLVADGDDVVAGQGLVIVEAMKMEHTVAAPASGTVAVAVRVGQKVTAGEALAAVHEEGRE